MSREFTASELMRMVGDVTEAAINPDGWSALFDRLEDHYPGTRIALLGHEGGRPSTTLAFHRNFPEDDRRAYAAYYVHTSPYVSRGLERLRVGEARLSEVVISQQELETTEYYNDFAHPRRLGTYGAGVILERGPERSVALSLLDAADDPERRGRQIQLLDLLTPHLTQALRLHRLLDRERQQAEAALRIFESWSHAALVLDGHGVLLTMNRAAEALVAEGDAMTLSSDGRPRGASHGVTQKLEQAISACMGPPTGGSKGLSLPRRRGAPLNAILSRLPNGAAFSGISGGAVLIVLNDPAARSRPPIDWIAQRYGLTPAESLLTASLVDGDTLAEGAQALGIQLSTARSRLKVIQAKTGCHRQTDLIRLALSAPRILP